jgi:hypothetical protein
MLQRRYGMEDYEKYTENSFMDIMYKAFIEPWEKLEKAFNAESLPENATEEEKMECFEKRMRAVFNLYYARRKFTTDGTDKR